MSTLPTILIVDDELRSLETLFRILEDDFDVKTAATIHDAEQIYRRIGCRSYSVINVCQN